MIGQSLLHLTRLYFEIDLLLWTLWAINPAKNNSEIMIGPYNSEIIKHNSYNSE